MVSIVGFAQANNDNEECKTGRAILCSSISQCRIILDNQKRLVDETLDGDITDVEYTSDDCLTDDDTR